jgi:hypothetical protein
MGFNSGHKGLSNTLAIIKINFSNPKHSNKNFIVSKYTISLCVKFWTNTPFHICLSFSSIIFGLFIVLSVFYFLIDSWFHSAPTCLWRWNRHSVPKRWHIKFRSRGITQKKTYNILNWCLDKCVAVRISLSLSLCACVCVCARACMCARVCVCVCFFNMIY